MEIWEYKSLICEGPVMEATLTALGEQGWESVGFAPVVQETRQSHFGTTLTATEYRVLLKRRKP